MSERGAARRLTPVLLGALAITFALAPTAQADCCLYWSTGFNGTIGRAPLTGFSSQWDFVRASEDGTFGVTTDGAHVYWGGDGSIGRARLDGSRLERGFIGGLADSRQSAVALDDAHVYWVEPGENSIGRANLDGSGVDEQFIGAELPISLALGDAHIYWANGIENAIGRANLHGSGVDETLIGGANLPAGVAVDRTHVYWTNFGGDSIGRANLDGSEADQDFIAPVVDPWGLAVDETGIYWTSLATGNISRANLDGSEIDEGLIEGAGALNLAFGDPGPIGRVGARRSQRLSRDAIRVRVKVSARQQLTAKAVGRITISAGKRGSYQLQQLPPRRLVVRSGDRRVLRLKPRGQRNERRIARALDQGKTATAAVAVTLVDRIGTREVEDLTIRLKPRPTRH